mgnify:CR=1 FL=1
MLNDKTLTRLHLLGLTGSALTAYRELLLRLLVSLQNTPRPAVVGISGAQGSGKSTLAHLLQHELVARGVRAQAVSLDDYYLGKAARQLLAQQVHPLLAQRGVPGTHNIARALADAQQVLSGQAVTLPVFDKATDDVAADRAPATIDMLLVEGWCLGISAQPVAELRPAINELEANEDAAGRWRTYVNQQLAGDYSRYWRLMTPFIWLQAPDWQSICDWRAKQEQQLWQQRGVGMAPDQLARFMLPFQRLTQLSFQQLPARANYTIVLNQTQQPQLAG